MRSFLRALSLTVLAVLPCASLVQARDRGALPPTVTVAQGALSMTVTHVDGNEALDIAGRVPGGSSATITLRGRFSHDLPIVDLSSFTVRADAAGAFSKRVSILQVPLEYGHIEITLDAAGQRVTVWTILGRPTSGLIENVDYQNE